MIVAFALLPSVFLLTWFLVWSRRSLIGGSTLTRRGAFLLAYLLFETLVLAITELSSIGHHFTRGVVLGSWALVLVVLVLLCGRGLASAVGAVVAEARTSSGRSRGVGRTTAALRTETAVWLAVPVVYFGIFVYLGLAYLPSNADSLDYHLARVMHWIANRSVAPFAAHFTAQVSYAPLAEYNLAHFHLLYGSDGLDGFVQLFAALVCLVAVSEVTRLLGGSSLVQAAAVVVCTTVPSLVLSATSTENNLFAASLGICLVYVLLALSPIRDWWSFSVFAALAASLAYMTKGTVLVLVGPAALAILIWRIVTEKGASAGVRFRTWAKIAAVMVLGAVLLAGPFIYQNESVFGSADGPDAQAVLSTDLTWRAAGADVVRSVAANFMMGNGDNGPETAVSKFMLRNLHDVYDVFGVRQDNWNYFVGPDNEFYYDAFEVRNFTVWDRSEDEGADPLDVVLLCFAGVASVILLIRGDRRMRIVVLIAIGLTVGFLAFAGISRWQVFQVRLFIPLFVAWSPLIALALARCSRWLLRVVLIVLVVASLPQLFDNAERPVLRNSYGPNPLAPYFLDSTDIPYVVRTATEFQQFSQVMARSTCRSLGIGNFVVLEYPVWVGLQRDGWNGQIQDVGVQNVTSRYESRAFHPCAIITDPGNTPYVGTFPDWVQLGFGPALSLAIAPDAIRHVEIPVSVTGFTSHVPGVRVFPGSNWLLDQSPPQLTGVGTFFIYSSRQEAVTLRIDGPGAVRPGISIVGSGTRGARSIPVPNELGAAHVQVPAGMTEFGLNDVPPPGHQTQVYGITVEPYQSAPAG
jgi:hypothetical protein